MTFESEVHAIFVSESYPTRLSKRDAMCQLLTQFADELGEKYRLITQVAIRREMVCSQVLFQASDADFDAEWEEVGYFTEIMHSMAERMFEACLRPQSFLVRPPTQVSATEVSVAAPGVSTDSDLDVCGIEHKCSAAGSQLQNDRRLETVGIPPVVSVSESFKDSRVRLDVSCETKGGVRIDTWCPFEHSEAYMADLEEKYLITGISRYGGTTVVTIYSVLHRCQFDLKCGFLTDLTQMHSFWLILAGLTAVLGYNGPLTQFRTGLNYCGFVNFDGDPIVASPLVGTAGFECGTKIRIRAGGVEAFAFITDHCEECERYGIDASPGLRRLFPGEGNPSVEWEPVSSEVTPVGPGCACGGKAVCSGSDIYCSGGTCVGLPPLDMTDILAGGQGRAWQQCAGHGFPHPVPCPSGYDCVDMGPWGREGMSQCIPPNPAVVPRPGYLQPSGCTAPQVPSVAPRPSPSFIDTTTYIETSSTTSREEITSVVPSPSPVGSSVLDSPSVESVITTSTEDETRPSSSSSEPTSLPTSASAIPTDHPFILNTSSSVPYTVDVTLISETYSSSTRGFSPQSEIKRTVTHAVISSVTPASSASTADKTVPGSSPTVTYRRCRSRRV